jgi:hypothetical protein
MEIKAVPVYLLLLFIIHRVCLITYRLYFHPLARFPGPPLAAASTLYRAYYEFWKDGKLLRKATKLHEIYGMLSRKHYTVV